MSWEFEKTSISKVDILEIVAEETLVKNKSKLVDVKSSLCLGFKFLRIKKPKIEMKMK